MKYLKIKVCCTFLAIAVLLAACSNSHKIPLEPIVENDIDEQAEVSDLDQLNDPPEEEFVEAESTVYPGTGYFISAKKTPRTQQSESKKGKYTLNFDGADLSEVAKVILSDTLNKNYVINPKVGGSVTLQTSRPLTKEELLPTLEMILRMNGVVLLHEDGLYRIEPAGRALSGARISRFGVAGQRLPSGYRIQIIPLLYIGVQEMQKILTPLLPPKAVVRTDVYRNLLLVAGTSRELENILDTISIFDVDFLKGLSVGIYPLSNVDSATVIKELEKLFGEGADSPVAGMFRLVPIERLNAVMVITPQPDYLKQAKLWIDRLDKINTASSGGAHVYRVQNVDAVELAATLNDIFGGRKKKSEIPAATVAPDLKPKEVTAKNKQPVRKIRSKKQLSLDDVGEVRIIADANNNSLVIVATAQEYEVISEVIKKLDVVPLQVLIDATIVQVRLTDELKYGLQWFFEHKGGSLLGTGLLADGGRSSPLPAAADLALAGSGFSYVLAANDVSVVLNALASDSRINVISSPSLMVLNNQEAFIQVGDQISIRTSETTNTNSTTSSTTGSTAAITSQFQQRDTGVTLKVKPRVNPGGLVIMEIDQKVDSVLATSAGASDNPDILQRQIKSTVAVQSGETLVLGGLISEDKSQTKSGIPLLHHIPLIGFLFGTTDTLTTRTELVVLITPRVVENMQDARAVTQEFKRKLTGIYEELPVDEDGIQWGW